MVLKHNMMLPNAHFRKDWKRRVKTWFDQPSKQAKRKQLRELKAKQLFPRPVKSLRPVVRCPTRRYSHKVRLGRGFTREELAMAKIDYKSARSIGISVDLRRVNKSEESLKLNVDRLLEYKSKLVVVPSKKRNPEKHKEAMSKLATAVQIKGTVMPIKNQLIYEPPRKLTKEEKEANCYKTLQEKRKEAKFVGKKKDEKEETA